MPTGPRPTARPGAGPGRGRPRARSGGRQLRAGGPAAGRDPRGAGGTSEGADRGDGPGAATATAPGAIGSEHAAAGSAPTSARRSGGVKPGGVKRGGAKRGVKRGGAGTQQARRRSSLTTRAVALAVVILMLTISYANSLRIYFAQSHDVAATKVEIADREARIADLRTELSRWDDPAFVRLQARTRLGWVVPGEIGFTVVDADGKPLGGGSELSTGQKPVGEDVPNAWYVRLWGSVEAADRPAPEPEPDPGAAKPITENNVDDAASAASTPR